MSAEKFEELPSEKKMRIINAGLECFGQYGYKKATLLIFLPQRV